MYSCALAVCSNRIIRDATDNTISIISIVEELNLPTLPGMLMALSVVFFLVREDGDPDSPPMTFRVTNGQHVEEFPVTADFQGKLRTRAMVQMGAVPVQVAGTLRFELLLTESVTSLGHWDVGISVISPPIVVATSA